MGRLPKRDPAKEIARDLMHAAVNNLVDLPSNHPAFERSFNIVTEFYYQQKARWDAVSDE